ncbi:HIT family protein [Alkalihalobacillus pseudalcaliphilus]|uniref:HIT family protein n=1 Tax=Alkalihalobacillus pseudalcaliphilus TaxID=79884 RepID=UPI00064DE97B|nr:HIT family protein [Alkalihalobacillus pseudalcaliphilus]KMK74967.1 HIT family hydrolase [Alkalihalobacillus pseudalcaliphilus]
MGDCFICNKHQGRITTASMSVYEDDFVYVGHIDRNGQPNYLGHMMIDLKRHVPSLADMSEEEAEVFGVTLMRVSKALKEVAKAEHIYTFVAGDAVPHLHMHIVPRYPNTPRKYWGASEVYQWEEAPIVGEEEVAVFCDRMKAFLSK